MTNNIFGYRIQSIWIWHLSFSFSNIHYMTKSMWTPGCLKSHSKITASTLLGRLSTRRWNIAAGTYFHSATRAIVRLRTDVGRLDLARSRPYDSSQRCLMGLRSGLCAGQSRSSTPTLTNHFCMELTLCTGALLCWNRKGASPSCCHKVGSTKSFRMSLHAVALIFPFTGTKRPSPNHEKQPRPLFLLHQTL